MKIKYFSQSGPRGNNQDHVSFLSLNDNHILAISDGMGGKEAGEIASEVCVKTIIKGFGDNPKTDIKELFNLSIHNLKKVSEEKNIKEMGATLTVCHIADKEATVYHVGDSRLYHLRNNGLISITKDQTEVQHLIDNGILSKKRAKNYKRKNVLISAMTNYSEYDLEIKRFSILPKDRIILLTDGAYNSTKKMEIRNKSISYSNIEDFIIEIKNAIEENNPTDDYSLICCEIE